jgi:hypothetical protein
LYQERQKDCILDLIFSKDSYLTNVVLVNYYLKKAFELSHFVILGGHPVHPGQAHQDVLKVSRLRKVLIGIPV